MPRISLWKDKKSLNYKFFDNHARQAINIGGTLVYVHKYLGPKEKNVVNLNLEESPYDKISENLNEEEQIPDVFLNSSESSEITEMDIQDIFYLENRDRKYDPNIYEIKAHYNPTDVEFDLRQFGLMLANDTLNVTFHYNDMVERIGRRIIPGDVLEFPHLRQEQLDERKMAINKYYVVEDAHRPSNGYDVNWWNHLWAVRAVPIHNQQEYFDILEKEMENFYGEGTGETLADQISILDRELEITDNISKAAREEVGRRKFIHKHIYIVPRIDEQGREYPFDPRIDEYPVLAFGDGIPPNGTEVKKGTVFPENPVEGEYFLRTDYNPAILFQRKGNVWKRIEANWRTPWVPAHDSLKRFINQEGEMKHENTGKVLKKRQFVSRALKPDL
jgi:hypothetical protein